MNLKEFEDLYIGDDEIKIGGKIYSTPKKNENGKYLIPYVNDKKFMEVDSINFQTSKYHQESITDHVYSVVARVYEACKNLDSHSLRIAIAIAMFHDIGKKYTIAINNIGGVCFYNHEELSSNILKTMFIDDNLGFEDVEERDLICSIIDQHLQLKTFHNALAKQIYTEGFIRHYGYKGYTFFTALDEADIGLAEYMIDSPETIDKFYKEVELGKKIVESF